MAPKLQVDNDDGDEGYSLDWHCNAVIELQDRWPELLDMKTALIHKAIAAKTKAERDDLMLKSACLLDASLMYSIALQNKRDKKAARKRKKMKVV